MNEEKIKIANEFIKSMSPTVTDFINNGDWEKRVDDISKKYSLAEQQNTLLKNSVLLVIIGLDDIGKLENAITTKIGLSTIIKDQIIEDVEKRIFEYALNFTEKKDAPKIVEKKPDVKPEIKQEMKVETPPTPKQQAQNQQTPTNPTVSRTVLDSRVPEIRPENLPEIVGSVRVNTVQDKPRETPKPVDKPIVNEQKNETSASRIVYKSTGSGEIVQNTGSVPRFTAVPMEETVSNNVNIKPIEKMADTTKPETITPPIASKAGVKVEAPKRYVSDPYREPLN